MKENKFCFISCINNKQYYEECLYYINKLNIPEGYEIEIISIEDSKSMCSGYNEAMKASTAKYKIYLHQDTFIINENFLYDILYIFENNDDIGMIGVAGSQVVPVSAIWWETEHKYGKVYESSGGILSELRFKEINKRYEEVKIIDGLIMITQYDLPWREELFKGYHFYDASQSTEFIKAGYKVVIPRQEKPWIIHDCGLAGIKDYEENRIKFVDEYYKDVFPLVSILIPTYNRKYYFELALKSAINQTYKNIEIIVGDNSDNDNTYKMFLEKYKDKYNNIKYIFNNGNIGAMKNFENLFKNMKGNYFNLLMDDDLISFNKIERMMAYYIEDSSISLVTSYRKLINKAGIELKDCSFNECLFDNDVVLSGDEFGRTMLTSLVNFIGEPSTTLVKINKESNEKKDFYFGEYLGEKYKINVDMAMWLQCFLEGKVAYIVEPLSKFRVHDNQDQKQILTQIKGTLELYSFINKSYKNNIFINKNEYIDSLKMWIKIAESIDKSDYEVEDDLLNKKIIDVKEELVSLEGEI